MSPVFDLSGSTARDEGLEAAASAIGRGKLVVLPTDTVYGVGADPFNPDGIAALLAAKGRGREKPPAVLVPDAKTVDGLAMGVPSYARRLMERFWPGGLTLIFRSQPSLMWDLGDTNGTVGLRMPDDEIALAVLAKTGPLAVSSANQTGERTATTITEAGFAFGPAVEIYLDGGERTSDLASTIIDCTKADPVLLRRGTVTPEQLREVLGPIDLLDSTGSPLAEAPAASPTPPQGEDAKTEDTQNDDVPVGGAEQSDVRWSDVHAGAAQGNDMQVPTPDADRPLTTRAAERERLRALGAEGRAGEATQVIPLAGIGAEPPFEREAIRSVELPTRTGDETN